MKERLIQALGVLLALGIALWIMGASIWIIE